MLASCLTRVYSGPDAAEVQRAKKLCLELLDNVKQQYEEFKARPPQQRGYSGDNRGGYGGGNNGYGGDRHQDRSNSYGGGGGGGGYGGYNNSPAPPTPGGGYMSPPNAQSTPAADPNAAYAAQYAQYYAQNGVDPYAAYGGYEA